MKYEYSDSRFFWLTVTWLVFVNICNANVIATDGSIPASMNAGGTVGNPAEYILGNAGAYDLSFDTDVYIGQTTKWNSLIIRTGSTLSVDNLSQIGRINGSQGSVTVTGANSTWSSPNLTVGYYGDGDLLVEKGGSVESDRSSIGSEGIAQGNVTVTGAGSTWKNTVSIDVGYFSKGSLLVTNGGSVINASSSIGVYSTGQSSALVTGMNSIWTNSGSLYIGPYSGDNQLTVADDALVTVDGFFDISIQDGLEDNFLRLDGGYFAWLGDNLDELATLLNDGKIQVWDMEAEAWANALDNPLFDYDYFDTDAEALAFSGYEGLGGYTILTSTAVPEPAAYAAMIGFWCCCLVAFRRRQSQLK